MMLKIVVVYFVCCSILFVVLFCQFSVFFPRLRRQYQKDENQIFPNDKLDILEILASLSMPVLSSKIINYFSMTKHLIPFKNTNRVKMILILFRRNA